MHHHVVHLRTTPPVASAPAAGTGALPAAHPGVRLTLLRHTLAIAEAATGRELVARTLTAARATAEAEVAAVLEAGGGTWVEADDRFRGQLDTMDDGLRARLLARPDEPTTVLADLGLPLALTATFGDGILLVADPGDDWPAADTATCLALLASHAHVALARLRELDVLRGHANSDPLTGLRHRRPFGDRLARARPDRTAIIAIDVDGFKKINDEYGHEAGDRALVTLVRALQSSLRAGDDLYRIGGDEFAVVLDIRGPDDGLSTAERLVTAARATGHTVSAGVAVHGRGETGRQTLGRADAALYRAKRAGRNAAVMD